MLQRPRTSRRSKMTPLHASVFQVGDGPTDYWNIDLRKTVAKLLRGIPGHRMPLDGPCQKPGTATQKCHKRFAAPCRTLLSPSPAVACSGSHAHRHHPLCVFQFPSHVVCIRFSQPDGCISDRRSSEPVRLSDFPFLIRQYTTPHLCFSMFGVQLESREQTTCRMPEFGSHSQMVLP